VKSCGVEGPYILIGRTCIGFWTARNKFTTPGEAKQPCAWIRHGLEIVQGDSHHDESYLFAVALLSLVVAGGCAKGGNGIVPSVTVTATSPVDVNALAIYPTQR